jgi:hypothetical protein
MRPWPVLVVVMVALGGCVSTAVQQQVVQVPSATPADGGSRPMALAASSCPMAPLSLAMGRAASRCPTGPMSRPMVQEA